ncbi:MAG TPA: DUF4214 domain-containing protein [Burkholderiaceae bacterium]|jgi:hypothetical protein
MKISHFTACFLSLPLLLTGCGGKTSSSSGPLAQQAAQIRPAQKQTGTGQTAADYANAVQELYVAYFGRPADPMGLTNFENALLAAGAPTDLQGLNAAYATNAGVRALIDSFGTSAEAKKLYGSGDTNAFVANVFQNVIGRAPLASGQSFWVDAITSGKLTQGDAALSIMAGALTNTTGQGLIDAHLINNRLAVAAYFTSQVASTGTIAAYSGTSAAAAARSMLANVTSNTDPAAYRATAGAVISGLGGTTGNQVLAVFAGSMAGGGDQDGPGINATFSQPWAVAVDSMDNLYVADTGNQVIRKITAQGEVSIYAGSPGLSGGADGTGSAARFNTPRGIAVDSAGNVYVADTGNCTIRKIDPSTVVTTLAGSAGQCGNVEGTGAAARFSAPFGVTVDTSGTVYVADTYNNSVRQITPGGLVTTFGAGFHSPQGIVAGSQGVIWVADTGNAQIVGISTSGRSALNVQAGVSFHGATGIAFDKHYFLYVADAGDNTIRQIDISTPIYPVVTTVAGLANSPAGSADGTSATATFNKPRGVAVDAYGRVFIADTNNDTVREFEGSARITTFAGIPPEMGSADGAGAIATFNGPQSLASDGAGNIYVADMNNSEVRKITPTGSVTTLAGLAGAMGSADGSGSAARFYQPPGVAADTAGNVYVADAQNSSVRKISSSGVVTTLAGGTYGSADGTGSAASFSFPSGVAVDGAGNVFVADYDSNTIRKITAAGVVTTVAGTTGVSGDTDGIGKAATFNGPWSIAVDGSGNLYVTEGSNIVRKITPNGLVSTLAGTAGVSGSADGTGAAAQFCNLWQIAVTSSGTVYVADTSNAVIRKITPSGVVTTVVGVKGKAGFVAGALPGGLPAPYGLTISGNLLYVSGNDGIAVVHTLP